MSRTCTIEGCDRPHSARGWCAMHWRRWRLYGDPLTILQPKTPRGRRCAVRGCQRSVKARGMCTAHITRAYRWGDPRPDQPLSHPRTAPKRWPAVALLEHVDSGRALARLLGMAERANDRWERVLLTNAQADTAALTLGLMAWEVWDDWFQVGAA